MTDSNSSEVSSLLSGGQREWLRGNDDALSSPDRVIRSRIKSRVRQGFVDLALIQRSDRLSSEDLMKSIRDESTSSSNAGNIASSGGDMDEELQPDTYDSVVSQLEMVSGTKIEDFGLENLISQVRKIKGQHGQLDDETVEMCAAAGAVAGLMGTGKTEKQARQWVELHWPESDDILDNWDKAMTFVDS